MSHTWKSPKTRASVREIQLPTTCFTPLRDWKNEQQVLALRLEPAWLGKTGNKMVAKSSHFGKNGCFFMPISLFKNAENTDKINTFSVLSCFRDSNPRPPHYQWGALPPVPKQHMSPKRQKWLYCICFIIASIIYFSSHNTRNVSIWYVISLPYYRCYSAASPSKQPKASGILFKR